MESLRYISEKPICITSLSACTFPVLVIIYIKHYLYSCSACVQQQNIVSYRNSRLRYDRPLITHRASQPIPLCLLSRFHTIVLQLVFEVKSPRAKTMEAFLSKASEELNTPTAAVVYDEMLNHFGRFGKRSIDADTCMTSIRQLLLPFASLTAAFDHLLLSMDVAGGCSVPARGVWGGAACGEMGGCHEGVCGRARCCGGPWEGGTWCRVT